MKTFTYTIAGAVSDAFSVIQELAEEMRSWYDNMPESLQGGDKGSQVEECADALENIDEVEIPAALDDSDQPHPYTFAYPIGRKRQSRADRLSDAVGLLQTVVDYYSEEQFDENDEAHEFADELQNVIDEAEGIEFPGMYG